MTTDNPMGPRADVSTSRSSRFWLALAAWRGLTGPYLAAWLAAAALLGAVTFWPALDNAFVYDDYAFIVDNPVVTQSGPWYRPWREPYWPRHRSADKLYRPLTIWSFRANTVLAGRGAPDPWSFHLVNLVLHGLACAGVAVGAYRLTGQAAAACIAGALFATHPVHAEAVVTAYGRAELLAGLFCAWLLALHLRPADEDRPRRVRFHVASSLLFLAALMSKEHALLVWPALLLIDLAHRRRSARDPSSRRLSPRVWFDRVLAPQHVGFALAAAFFFCLRFSVFGQFYRLDNSRVRAWESPLAQASMVEHLLTPFRLLWLTLQCLVLPQRLCPTWSVPALSPADRLAPDVLAGMVLMVILVGLTWFLWRRRSLSGAVLGGLLVVLAIPIQALPLAHWFYAERWLYLPTVFIAMLIGSAAGRLRTPAAATGLAIALVLLPSSWQYTAKFADNETMHREVVRRQPDNFHGWRNLAAVLYFQGRYPEAILAANELIRRFGPVSDAYMVQLKSYLELGDGERALEAIDQYEYLRRHLPAPQLTEDRQRAQALIAESHRLGRGSLPAAD